VPHVLVIEDDLDVRRGILRSLSDASFAASSAATGLAGLETVVSSPPDLVVLDLGLPDVGGRELVRMIRSVNPVPIIVATARDDEREIVAVLNAGADDYLVKPFGGAQLIARVRAVLRRGGAAQQDPGRLRVGELTINRFRRTVELAGRPLSLAPKEFDLLCYLCERRGEVVTKRELLAEVWRMPYQVTDKTVDVHLSWLRRKLGESAQAPRFLHTVRGIGIRLDPPAG
jgi:DNA-binding response OmpR family regulator